MIMMASRLNRCLIARAIRVRRSHHHSQFFNTFFSSLSHLGCQLCSGVSALFSGHWPNGSSSISLAALTIPANYFPCRVIFLGCSRCFRTAAGAVRHYFNIYSPHLSVFFCLSRSLSRSLCSLFPFYCFITETRAHITHLIAAQVLKSLLYRFLSGFCNWDIRLNVWRITLNFQWIRSVVWIVIRP